MRFFMKLSVALCLWHLLCKMASIPFFILPPPEAVLVCFYQNITLIGWHTFLSMGVIMCGLILALMAGILTAIIMFYVKGMRVWLMPFMLVMQSTPSFALYPLLLLWCSYGIWPRIIVVTLSCYFSVTVCCLKGFESLPSSLQSLEKTLRAKPWPFFWQVRFMACLPHLFSGIRLAAIHAPLTILVSEWIGAQGGLGYLLMLAHGRLQIDLTFALVLCLIALTFFLHTLTLYVEKKVIFWRWN